MVLPLNIVQKLSLMHQIIKNKQFKTRFYLSRPFLSAAATPNVPRTTKLSSKGNASHASHILRLSQIFTHMQHSSIIIFKVQTFSLTPDGSTRPLKNFHKNYSLTCHQK